MFVTRLQSERSHLRSVIHRHENTILGSLSYDETNLIVTFKEKGSHKTSVRGYID